MTIDLWLKTAEKRLASASINTGRLDALVLLEDCLGKDRALLLAHPEIALSDSNVAMLDGQLQRRARHEPLAYIRGKTEFYGRNFFVDRHVLEPRPESETMITLLKTVASSDKNLQTSQLKIGDIGSGSGCLGITAALELQLRDVTFHDIDPNTLPLARRNAERYKLRGKFLESDLLGGRTYDVILANLPYVPDNFLINTAAGHEPRIAIFGGPDGLDLYRRLFAQTANLITPPQYICTEALPPQHEALTEIAGGYGYGLHMHEDFIQVFSRASV
jgi:release factor glutamine methyltransferase